MSRKAEGYTRLTVSVIFMALAFVMPNIWSIILVSIIALLSLLTGLAKLIK